MIQLFDHSYLSKLPDALHPFKVVAMSKITRMTSITFFLPTKKYILKHGSNKF